MVQIPAPVVVGVELSIVKQSVAPAVEEEIVTLCDPVYVPATGEGVGAEDCPVDRIGSGHHI